MIEKIKRKLNTDDNHGSSFVLVIVATTFMCILAAALLMGTLMTYKLKYYKINSLNNFYEVETALDEIYAGVGAATNEHLYSAYTTTAELVVVYDTANQRYTTMDNDEANKLFKRLFMTGFTNDASYKSLDQLATTLQSLISNEKSTLNPNGVELIKDKLQLVYTDENGNTRTQYYNDKGNVSYKKKGSYTGKNIKSVTIKDVTVKREVTLTGKDAATSSGTYEQSITTDIVLTEPEYNVSFDINSTSTDSIYEYAVLADMGVEIGEDDDTETVDVSINGNIYAANDYYNKNYNDNEDTKVSVKYENKPTTTWGSTDDSVYSGIFVNGKKSSLTMLSDVIVCPGTLTAYNGAGIKLRGRSQRVAELWADGIAIAGKKGGSINAAANAYIYDDAELNAEKSSLVFSQDSNYFGYSYNAADTRNVNFLKDKGYLATGFSMRSHFSDSAVIVNGKSSTLDMQNLNSLYIAGKSYIEFSKIAASSVDKNDTTITVDENAELAYTSLKDYSTGQSLDVKTNQLMFLTQWTVVEDSEQTDADTGITTVKLRFPKTTNSVIKDDLYDEFLEDMGSGDYEVKAIKQTVSGHDYYYLYIDGAPDTNGVSKAEQFALKYYDILENYTTDITMDMYNVRKYENFEVKLILPDEGKINASAAVTDQNKDNDELFLRSSADTTNDVKAVVDSVFTGKSYAAMYDNATLDTLKQNISGLRTDSATIASNAAATQTQLTSNMLSYMYINMKDHLTVANRKDDAKADINAWSLAGYTRAAGGYDYTYDKARDEYSYDYSINPISYYVDLPKVIKDGRTVSKHVGDAAESKEQVMYICPRDVVIGANNADGSVQGIIIAGGDVRFAANVKSFRGMIITGSKLIIDHSMNISSDASFVANILDKRAEETTDTVSQYIVSLFKNYVKSTGGGSSTVTGVSISDISYEDILVFQNWKRNIY